MLGVGRAALRAGIFWLLVVFGFVVRADVALYVSNSNDTITKFTGGTASTFASGLSGPNGLAFDAQGNLFCANYTGGTISKITPDGTVSPFASGLNNPQYLAFAPNGDLYVSNGNATGSNEWVKKITPGGLVSTFSTALPRPNGLAFDGAGNLYAVDYSTTPSRVFKFNASGVPTAFATLSGSNAHARGYELASDGANGFYCVDDVSGIEKISSTGVVTNFATTAAQSFGLAMDGAGNLYTGKTGGPATVYQVAPAGGIQSIALGNGAGGISGVAVQSVPEPGTSAAIVGVMLTVALGRRTTAPIS